MSNRKMNHAEGFQENPEPIGSDPADSAEQEDPVQQTQQELESWRRYLLVPSLGAGPLFADDDKDPQPEKENPSGFDLNPLDGVPGSDAGGDGTGLE